MQRIRAKTVLTNGNKTNIRATPKARDYERKVYERVVLRKKTHDLHYVNGDGVRRKIAPPGGWGHGSPKISRVLKDAIILAAEELGEMTPKVVGLDGKQYWGRGPDGLQGYLRWLGAHEPKAYAMLLGKVLPYHITVEGSIEHKVFRDRAAILEELKNRGLPEHVVYPRALPPLIEHKPIKADE